MHFVCYFFFNLELCLVCYFFFNLELCLVWFLYAQSLIFFSGILLSSFKMTRKWLLPLRSYSLFYLISGTINRLSSVRPVVVLWPSYIVWVYMGIIYFLICFYFYYKISLLKLFFPKFLALSLFYPFFTHFYQIPFMATNSQLLIVHQMQLFFFVVPIFLINILLFLWICHTTILCLVFHSWSRLSFYFCKSYMRVQF